MVRVALALVIGITLAACGGGAATTGSRETGPGRPTGKTQRGLATWYGGSDGFNGGPTASGERFDHDELTAAHRTLPFNTMVRVTNLKNNRSVVVRINDRGPYGGHGHIIDLSRAAARQIDMIDAGIVPVRLEVLTR